jgi:hypothetical protein
VISRFALIGVVWLGACAGAPEWQEDLTQAIRQSRAQRQDLAVFFAMDDNAASDHTWNSLVDPAVRAELAAGDFAAVVCDAFERAHLYRGWIGYGEGFGLAVLDADGRAYAARPGPQDPNEAAAFLRRFAAARKDQMGLRDMLAQPVAAPMDQHALGCLLLELGCCNDYAEDLLLKAATAGVMDARHRLARHYATVGDVAAARRWMNDAPRTPPALVTEGYVLFKERNFADAASTLEQALTKDQTDDERQRAMLYLGKALHEAKEDGRALTVLKALAGEGRGSVFEAAAVHMQEHVVDPGHVF